MVGPREYYTQLSISKSHRERQILHDITYMQNLKKQYELIHMQNKQTQTYKTNTVIKGVKELREGQIRSMGLVDTN